LTKINHDILTSFLPGISEQVTKEKLFTERREICRTEIDEKGGKKHGERKRSGSKGKKTKREMRREKKKRERGGEGESRGKR